MPIVRRLNGKYWHVINHIIITHFTLISGLDFVKIHRN